MRNIVLLTLVFMSTSVFAERCKINDGVPFWLLDTNESLKTNIKKTDNEVVKNKKLLDYYQKNCPKDDSALALRLFLYGESLLKNNQEVEGIEVMEKAHLSYINQKDLRGALASRDLIVRYYLQKNDDRNVRKYIRLTVDSCKSDFNTDCLFLFNIKHNFGEFVEGIARYE